MRARYLARRARIHGLEMTCLLYHRPIRARTVTNRPRAPSPTAPFTRRRGSPPASTRPTRSRASLTRSGSISLTRIRCFPAMSSGICLANASGRSSMNLKIASARPVSTPTCHHRLTAGTSSGATWPGCSGNGSTSSMCSRRSPTTFTTSHRPRPMRLARFAVASIAW